MIDRTTAVLFVRYVVYAGVATVVDMGVLYLVTEYIGLHYQVSAVLGYCAGMVTNYTLNKAFTFENESRRFVLQFFVFSSVALVGLLINQLVLYALVEYLHVWYMYAKLCAVGVVALWSFWGHRRFTFGML